MSGSVDLTIETGTDWAIQTTWNDGAGDPIPFTNAVMEIRSELNPRAPLIARLDESGQSNGTLSIVAPGVLQARMTADQTSALRPGNGFWDIFVDMGHSRVRLVFGTVAIAAHVTESV